MAGYLAFQGYPGAYAQIVTVVMNQLYKGPYLYSRPSNAFSGTRKTLPAAVMESKTSLIMKILIIYGTSEGHTRKISRFIESVLDDHDHKATIADATEEPPAPDNFDMVMIGSSIHAHQYHRAVLDYITKYAPELNAKKSVFFSVCMAMASKIPEEHEEVFAITSEFLERSGWKPEKVWYLAGALRFTQYDYFKRLIMRLIAKRQGVTTDGTTDIEYTDWEALRAMILEFIKEEE